MINDKLKYIFSNFKQPKTDATGKKGIALALILMYSVSMMAFLSTTQTAYASTQNTVVTGLITDEAGVGVNNATVILCTPAGALVTSTITSAIGEFVLANVEFGTYNLNISGSGYAQSITSINVNTFGQQLGIFVLSSAITLSTSVVSAMVNPGDKITIPLTVKNSREDPQVATFSVSDPTGWFARILNGNYQVTQVSLTSGQSMTLQLEIMVPSTAVAETAYNISVTALGTTNSSLTFTLFVQTQSTAFLSGKVVDESGKGMDGVEVDSYSSTGLFLKSAETSSDGSFTIELPITDAASIQFSKDGYKDIAKAISLNTNNETVNLGSIVLGNALKLSSSILSIVASPGDKLLLPFVLSNVGADTEALTFSGSYPASWSARVLDSNGHEIKSASLSAGATSNYQLEITVPTGSTGSYNLALAAAGKITSTLSFEVSVGSTNETVLSCQFPGKSASPWDTVTFQATLMNPFNVATRFSVSVDSVPSNWTATVKTASGDSVTEILLDANAVANLVVEVKSLDSATAGNSYGLLLHAESVGQTVTDSLQLTVSLTAAANESAFSCQFPGKSASPGDTVTFQATLMNPFNVATRFRVSVDSVPSNWTATVKTASGDSVTEVLLNGGESVNLIVQVDTSASATTGQTYELSVKAESDSYNITSSIPVTVALTAATNEVALTAALPEIAITAGNAASYSVTVANLGVTDRLLFLSVQPPTDWTAVFKSGNTEVTTLYLYSGNTSALTLAVTPRSTVSVGSYVIPIQVKSENGAILDELNLTTTVTGSYAITLTLSTYMTSTTSGGTTTFTATITNSGYSTLTGVVADITLPETTWSDTVTPVQVGTLGPKETAMFTVTVTTTDTTVSGDYMITATASSDQASSDSSQVRLTVSTSTSWGIYGVVIAVVFIIALVIVFKKFKRR